MVGVMGVGAKAVIAFTALCVSACSASADSFESGDRFLFFSGTDLWRNGGFLHGGLLWSPGGLDRQGFVLKSLISGGTYRYTSGSIGGATVRGREFVALLMPGWRFKWGTTEVDIYAGLDAENHRLSPDDPDSSLRGTDVGVRMAADYWTEPSQGTMLQLNGSLSTIDNSYSAHAAFGWRMFERFYLGPEIARFSSGDYSQNRVGLQLTSLRAGFFEWSAAVGWANDSDSRSGAYVRLGMFTRR
jgi:hypothetical protein